MRFAKLRNENGMRVSHPEQIECSSVTFQSETGEAVAWDKDGRPSGLDGARRRPNFWS